MKPQVMVIVLFIVGIGAAIAVSHVKKTQQKSAQQAATVAAELANNWALRSWRDVRRGVAPADGALRNSAGHRDAKAATGGLIAMGQPKPLGHSYDRPAKGGITAVEIDIASRWPGF